MKKRIYSIIIAVVLMLSSIAAPTKVSALEIPYRVDVTKYTSDEANASAQIREQVKAHANTVTVYVRTKDKDLYAVFNRIWNNAFAETTNPDEGDYLYWQMSSMAASYNALMRKEKGNNTYYTKYTINVDYFTGSGAINENKVIANESSIMNKTRLPEPFETVRSDKLIKEDIVQYNSRKAEESRQISLFEDKLLDEKNKNNYRIIGQLFDTYWLIEFEDRFYMMDQHAAHEKVLYEKTMNKLRTQKIDTQMLMPPIILTLNMNEEEVLKRNMSIFNKLGYEIEEFGGNEYKVTGIPAGFPKLDYRQMLTDLIDGLMQDGRMTDMDILTEKVASMSCKAAIKGNNEISYEEAKELMEELMKADNPYNCPHGRPTLIVMSKYDIEKKFKRIV